MRRSYRCSAGRTLFFGHKLVWCVCEQETVASDGLSESRTGAGGRRRRSASLLGNEICGAALVSSAKTVALRGFNRRSERQRGRALDVAGSNRPSRCAGGATAKWSRWRPSRRLVLRLSQLGGALWKGALTACGATLVVVRFKPWDPKSAIWRNADPFDRKGVHRSSRREIRSILRDGLSRALGKLRVDMGGAQADVTGHFRHESRAIFIGMLIKDRREEPSRPFGDHKTAPTYASASKHHYNDGTPADLRRPHLGLASMHPLVRIARPWAEPIGRRHGQRVSTGPSHGPGGRKRRANASSPQIGYRYQRLGIASP